MRLDHALWITMAGLLLPGWASANVPIMVSGTLTSGPNSASGSLPLTVPLDPGNCSGSGTATAAVVGGTLEIDLSGSFAGAGCNPSSVILDSLAAFQVPNEGDRTTQILWTAKQASSSSSIPVQASVLGSEIIEVDYTSSLLGGLVSFGWISLVVDPATGGYQKGIILDYVPGDSVSDHVWGLRFYPGLGGGTLAETWTFEASLLPAPNTSSVPLAIGWLVAGVLLGLGMRTLRQRSG